MVPRKAFATGHRLTGLLREGQQRQATRPNVAPVAGLADQAVVEIEVAK